MIYFMCCAMFIIRLNFNKKKVLKYLSYKMNLRKYKTTILYINNVNTFVLYRCIRYNGDLVRFFA